MNLQKAGRCGPSSRAIQQNHPEDLPGKPWFCYGTIYDLTWTSNHEHSRFTENGQDRLILTGQKGDGFPLVILLQTHSCGWLKAEYSAKDQPQSTIPPHNKTSATDQRIPGAIPQLGNAGIPINSTFCAGEITPNTLHSCQSARAYVFYPIAQNCWKIT
jgi:hypothetical protein